MSVITLLTDFGTVDEYVGVMKGVILSIAPDVHLIDLTHGIDPQDVVQGAYILKAAVEYFPSGSIHLAVVDPGVGGERAAVAVRCGRHFYVAPDNGILSLILKNKNAFAVRIANEDLFRKPVSPTFHGRDIFAPAAAYLSAGHDIKNLGPTIPSEALVRLPSRILEKCTSKSIAGRVVAIDRFGNLMTNITARAIDHFYRRQQGRQICVWVNHTPIPGLAETYCRSEEGGLLALIGSRGYLEISVNGASAAAQLNVHKGDPVTVRPLQDENKNDTL